MTGAMIGLALACGVLLVIVAVTAQGQAHRSATAPRLSRLITAAGVPWVTPSRLVISCLATAFAAAAIALIVSALPVVGVISGALGATVPIIVLRRRAGLRDRAVRAAWPDAVDGLVSGVRAGMSLPEAVGALAQQGPMPLRPAFAQFVAEHRSTGSFAKALGALEARLSDPIADRIVACLLIARDVGGSDLGRVLRNLSALLREDARMRAEIEGRQSWTVSAARMAVAAPWITLALLCTRPEAVQSYRTTVGACILLGAAVVSVLAYRLMMRIGRLPAERRLAS